jgi:glycosyltransferase involved in cell wall biosynthesis
MHLLAITETNDRSEIELYRTLASKGHKVDLICAPHWKGEAPLIEGGVRVVKLPIRHRLDGVAIGEIKRLIHSSSPDVIYAPINRALSVSLMATRKHKHTAVIGYRGTTGHLSRWDPASWLTYFHPRLKHIVCVSEAVRQYLLGKRIPANRLQTIYKGHRVEWYDDIEPVDLTEFGIPQNAFVIGFTGNIRPVKGIDVLLRSLPLLPPELNIHALLVGEVRDEGIKTMASTLGVGDRAHFVGYHHNAPALAGACDAFVMPSVEREGLPRAVIEAMAQRIPAIVSNVGGLPELVENGVSGIVTPPRDPQALANAIVTMASNAEKRKAMGIAARERIATTFNVDSTIHNIEALFQSVIDQG